MDAWVLAGTRFARARDGSLRNRVVVYGPDGRVAYTQDKVYLTEFERDVLGLEAAPLGAARGFRIHGYQIGVTICRDTFFEEWEELFEGFDLWIDVKANGVPFTAEERARFLRALPARLAPAHVRYGMTVCLTGGLLDLLWEGESSWIRTDGKGIEFLDRADSPRESELIVAEILPEGDS
jgi:predicted amidohydrolase